MNLAEYRAKRTMLEKEMHRFSLIKAGCQRCEHNDFGTCAQIGEPIPVEFMTQVEQCEMWVLDPIPF